MGLFQMAQSKKALIIGLILMLFGSLLAMFIQTDFGKVEIKEVSFVTNDNAVLAGMLYIPKTASAKNPRPAVVCVHGGNSTRHLQSAFAIELARRDYVVFAIDQTKNGLSSLNPAAENGNLAAVAYVKTLDFVDKNNIGVEGHSMGGGVFTAVVNNRVPGVRSAVLNGVSLRVIDEVDPSPASLHMNVAYVIGQYDENAGPTNWRVNGPRYANTAPDVKRVFGVTEDIEVGRIYGSVSQNNVRVMYQPKTWHVWMLYSTTAVKLNLDFFNMTMVGSNGLDTQKQIWMWKEIGVSISYIGLFAVIFGLLGILANIALFKPALTEIASPQMSNSLMYWIFLLLITIAPIIAVQPLYMRGNALLQKLPYYIGTHINGILFWQLVTVAIILVINLLLKKVTPGYDWNIDKKLYAVGWKSIGMSFIMGLIIFIAAYSLTHFVYFLFNVPVKLLQGEADLFTLIRFKAFIAYLPLYTLYYLVLCYAQMSGLDVKGGSTKQLYIVTIVANLLGILIFTALFYGTVPFMGISVLHNQRFAAGVLAAFIPGIIACSLFEVYAYKKTGNIYAGAFANALIFAWLSVASGGLI